ncbi:hypothetical protein DNTS_025497 [Danionella cerebrum]|uniref:non-specific serine/threonine protein kinase n=1 Tax=Danionella cerebrum TaxID=2873325 RepID=A0A553R995_9TELE|nr:hypothetical protein DNTS_025497 [Danionella translucida]
MVMLQRAPVCPSVIQLYEWFDRGDSFMLILEFPHPCEDLRTFVKRMIRVDEPIARRLMHQLVLAVQHCIDRGVFHNDIHTKNILVNTDSLELKLIDFGSAHLVKEEGYDSAAYVGAKQFTPPEVFQSPKYHAVPTNVWAMGVVLFYMVNGHLPYSSVEDELEECALDWSPRVSIECRHVILMCLRHRPENRPAIQEILLHPWLTTRILIKERLGARMKLSVGRLSQWSRLMVSLLSI